MVGRRTSAKVHQSIRLRRHVKSLGWFLPKTATRKRWFASLVIYCERLHALVSSGASQSTTGRGKHKTSNAAETEADSAQAGLQIAELGKRLPQLFENTVPLVPDTAATHSKPACLRQPLDQQTAKRVQAYWKRSTGLHKVVAQGPANLQVTVRDLHTLRINRWLNDQVVNLFMSLLQERNDRLHKKLPKVSIFSSFFWTRLACFSRGYDFQGVKRWTKKVDVFEKDLLLVPINHSNLHWCLAALDMRSRTLLYFDSLDDGGVSGASGHKVLRTLHRWVQDEAADKGSTADARPWKRQLPMGPRLQQDASSCGVFLCMCAERLAAGCLPPFDFSQADIPRMRLAMAVDICRLRVDV